MQPATYPITFSSSSGRPPMSPLVAESGQVHRDEAALENPVRDPPPDPRPLPHASKILPPRSSHSKAPPGPA